MRRCYGARTSGRSPWGGGGTPGVGRFASLITALDRPAAATDARSASFTNWKLIVSAERCDHRPNTGTCMCTCLRDAGAPRNICSARPAGQALRRHLAIRRAHSRPGGLHPSHPWTTSLGARSGCPRQPTAHELGAVPSTPSTQNGQDQARQDPRRPARAEPRRQGCCGIRTARNIENIGSRQRVGTTGKRQTTLAASASLCYFRGRSGH